MSLLADLHEEMLEDTAVMAAVAQYKGDPELTEYTTLIALVKVLVAQKAELTKQNIDLRNKALPDPILVAKNESFCGCPMCVHHTEAYSISKKERKP